jgi:lipopolysaccharide assembly protein A
MGRLLVTVLLVAAFCLGAAVSYFNWHPVAFHYLAGELEAPLIALMLAAFVLGVVVMWLLSLARVFLLGRESRRQQREIRELEAELKNLRNLELGATPPRPATPERPAIPPVASPNPGRNA